MAICSGLKAAGLGRRRRDAPVERQGTAGNGKEMV